MKHEATLLTARASIDYGICFVHTYRIAYEERGCTASACMFSEMNAKDCFGWQLIMVVTMRTLP